MKTKLNVLTIKLLLALSILGMPDVHAQGNKKNAITPITNRVITEDGTSLFYKDWGEGETIIFLHSWGVNSDIWQYQMQHLANSGFRCIAYDRRGHGRSDQPWNGYDYNTLASDLNTVIEQLKLDNITLVSHSMAGGEIIRYLSIFGQKTVSRIILTSPNLPFMLNTVDNPDGVDQTVIDTFHKYLQSDINATITAGVNSFFGNTPSVSNDMIEWGISLFNQTSLRALIECNRSNMQTDFRKELSEIRLPTLIIHGDADVSAPLALTAERCSKLISNSILKIYNEAPHGIILTHKETIAKDIFSFITNPEKNR